MRHTRCPFVPGDVYVNTRTLIHFYESGPPGNEGDVFTVISVTPNEQSKNWAYEGCEVNESSFPLEGVHFYPRAWNVQVMVGSQVKTFIYDHWNDHDKDYKFYRSFRRLASGLEGRGEKTHE